MVDTVYLWDSCIYLCFSALILNNGERERADVIKIGIFTSFHKRTVGKDSTRTTDYNILCIIMSLRRAIGLSLCQVIITQTSQYNALRVNVM